MERNYQNRNFYNYCIKEFDDEGNIENITFLSRSAISFVGVDGYNIIYTIVNFDFEIKESI